MYLRQLIQLRLESSFHIYNREGALIPEAQIKSEYQVIRQYLLDHHNGPGERIALKLNKDYRYFLCILAALEVGVTYIPMKHDYPMDRVAQIQEDSNFRLLIDDQKIEEILNYKEAKVHSLKTVNAEDEAYMIFTSGSTGKPKGVIIQRKALENFFRFMGEAFPRINAQDKLLQVTEFTFDISLVDVALFLNRNVEIHFSNFNSNIFKLGFEVDTYRITILNTVPNNLNMFLSGMVAERMDYHCLKHLFIAGSRFSYGLYQKCLHYFKPDVDVYNLYGPTEATVYSHYKKLTYQDQNDCVEGNVSIGRPLPGFTAHVMVEGQIAPVGVRGELYISGVQVMKGYINNPEQTAQVLVQMDGKTYYRTGDLAFRTEENDFFIVGRTDDTIKYRGFRINLLDIDSYITRIPYVQDSITIAIPHEESETQTLGFIMLKETKTIKELKEDLSKLLLDYQIPEKIIFVDSYPTNVSGKVCRKTLKDQYLEAQKA